MWKRSEISKTVNWVRRAARKEARLPFAGGVLVNMCARVEAGMPGGYLLAAAARPYVHVPEIEDVVAILAGRVGNPRIAPKPPLWPLLALLLLEWRDSVDAGDVLERPIMLGEEDEVQRGLLLVTHLFPELNSWLGDLSFNMSRWERALAMPLAARKLVLLQVSD